MRILSVAVAACCLGACASGQSDAPRIATTVGPDQLMSAEVDVTEAGYRIGPSDLLKITVFQVPDLSFDEIRVDASGRVQLPLLGSIQAAGLTPAQLSQAISEPLRAQYLRNPQVTVTVSEAASQKITVDGAVTKPGVYQMRGRTSLLQAIAMAEGPARTADLRNVAVFRTVDDRRMVALFDLNAIRAGQMHDPIVNGDDIIVVDTSRLSVAMREVLTALPGLAVFAYF